MPCRYSAGHFFAHGVIYDYAVTMQKPLYLLLVVCIPFSVNAEIYKGTDAEGNVTFSDKETPNSEIIPMPSPNTVQMPEAIQQVAEEKATVTTYTSFRIVQPTTNLTLRENAGNVPVSLELTPDLDTAAGHSIVIYLDGKPVIRGSSGLTAQLPDVSRGSHGVKAQVKDKNNKTLIASNKVIFHMKRLSELHPKPAGPTIGPVDADGNAIPPSTNRPGPTNPDGTSIKPGPQNPAYKPGPIIVTPAP